MLTKHKNAFLTAIVNGGFDVSKFEAIEENVDNKGFIDRMISDAKFGQPALIIRLKKTPHLMFVARALPYTFDEMSYRHSAYVPNFYGFEWHKGVPVEKVLDAFREWLEKVVRRYFEDCDIPDYWSQLREFGAVTFDSFTGGEGGTGFTEGEKASVRKSIDQFRVLVAENFNPSAEQAEFINEQLDYLSKAVDRLSRIDWRAVALSALVNIAVNLSVNTEQGRFLFTLFQQAFQKLLN